MSMSLRVDRSQKSLRELSQDAVRRAILEFRFVPGERLTERALCDHLGVSRSVVREVLRFLEAEGLIEVTPNKGPVVARVKPEDAEEIYELRSLLEGAAAAACARVATPEDLKSLEAAVDDIEKACSHEDPRQSLNATALFYEMMFRIAGKKLAWEIVKSFNVRINGLRALTISSANRRTIAAQEIRELLRAIESGDEGQARRISETHVENAAKIAREVLDLSKRNEDYITGRLQAVRDRTLASQAAEADANRL